MNPYIYSQDQLVLDKGAENTQWRKGNSFNILGKQNAHMQKNEMKPYLTALKTTK